MCGIAGMCSFSEDFCGNKEIENRNNEILINMRNSIAHRGNDQTGEYLESHIGLSHTRLSIRDIENGKQPMINIYENNIYAIVYNGEIYNADEISRDLRKRGVNFETTSDTEVILKAYICFGIKCVEMLNGIFAFAIWDKKREQLCLIRDRLGVKPLFYSVLDNKIVFGSEIKTLFSCPQIEPKINMESMREVLGIGPARTPGCGVFVGINEVLPGNIIYFTSKGIKHEEYWKLESNKHQDSYKDTVDRVSYLLRDAITRQNVSDVPICSFLSGGIDSSVVTAISSKHLNEIGKNIDTYSFAFTENDKYFKANSFQPSLDQPYVDIMKNALNTKHTNLICKEDRLVELLTESMIAKDLPGMADVDASMLYFCKLVGKRHKVVLTGECADEIFGGYPWFYKQELLDAKGFPWSYDMEVRNCLLNEKFRTKLSLNEYSYRRYIQSLQQMQKLDGESEQEEKRRANNYLNIKWFMQTLLDRMDRTSMNSGLEARVPFADHRIVEYVYNVPWEMKRKKDVEKSLLRDAMTNILPKEILHRKKSPYPKTYNPIYENLLRKKFSDILEKSDEPMNIFVDKKQAQEFLKTKFQYGKPWFGQLMASPQLLAYFIQINEWIKRYNPIIDETIG